MTILTEKGSAQGADGYGFTVRFAVLVTPLYCAEIVTTTVTEAGDVVIVKNSHDRTVAPDNGLNGWNLPWDEWIK